MCIRDSRQRAQLVLRGTGHFAGQIHIFPGQAAFLLMGAMLATSMSANVFFWIIPGPVSYTHLDVYKRQSWKSAWRTRVRETPK